MQTEEPKTPLLSKQIEGDDTKVCSKYTETKCAKCKCLKRKQARARLIANEEKYKSHPSQTDSEEKPEFDTEIEHSNIGDVEHDKGKSMSKEINVEPLTDTEDDNIPEDTIDDADIGSSEDAAEIYKGSAERVSSAIMSKAAGRYSTSYDSKRSIHPRTSEDTHQKSSKHRNLKAKRRSISKRESIPSKGRPSVPSKKPSPAQELRSVCCKGKHTDSCCKIQHVGRKIKEASNKIHEASSETKYTTSKLKQEKKHNKQDEVHNSVSKAKHSERPKSKKVLKGKSGVHEKDSKVTRVGNKVTRSTQSEEDYEEEEYDPSQPRKLLKPPPCFCDNKGRCERLQCDRGSRWGL